MPFINGTFSGKGRAGVPNISISLLKEWTVVLFISSLTMCKNCHWSLWLRVIRGQSEEKEEGKKLVE